MDIGEVDPAHAAARVDARAGDATTEPQPLYRRSLRLGRRRYPLIGPDPRDPRLHVALVVVSLQVLGQTVLHFDISIAQILIALTTCAVIDSAIEVSRHKVITWPSSALLTGNGVAFVLRVPGTPHGDWWSVRGGWIFAAVAAVSLLSKYLIRVDGRPLFNPSNFGLVLCFLTLGSRRVEPLDFWWVRPGLALGLALALIVAGGLLLARRMKMFGLVAGFWLANAAALAVLAARGHCITARWHIGPVCGRYLWTVLVTSPEVLVFMFFMITDPKTTPRGRTARQVYGVAIALVFVALATPQRTEYATKVALLGALALVCAARPLLERLAPAAGAQARTYRVRLVAVITSLALAYTAIVAGVATIANTPSVPASASAPTDCANTASTPTLGSRPTTRAGPSPTVTVQDPINIATPISREVAQQIVHDVLDDLAIAAVAIEHRDPTLIAGVARFPWLEDLISTICGGSSPVVVPTYHFTHAIVRVARREVGQKFPEIDVDLQGDVRDATITRSNPPRRVSERQIAYRNTFVVTKAGGYWVICGNRSDRRTAACVTTT